MNLLKIFIGLVWMCGSIGIQLSGIIQVGVFLIGLLMVLGGLSGMLDNFFLSFRDAFTQDRSSPPLSGRDKTDRAE